MISFLPRLTVCIFLFVAFLAPSPLGAQGVPPQGMPPQGLPRWMAMQSLAYKAKAKKEYAKARHYFKKAIESAPPGMVSRLKQQILVTYLDEANEARGAGNYKKALEILHKVEKIARSQGDKHYVSLFRREIANTWLAMGNYDQAKKAYFWAGLYAEIGNVLLHEGKINEALGLYKSLVFCPKEKKKVYVKGAADLFRQGESVKCPHDGSPVFLSDLDSIGLCHMQLGQHKMAESAFKAGLKNARDKLTAQVYYGLLGRLYEKMQRWDDAFQAYRRAGAKVKVAEILMKMGKKDAAKLWYEEVLKENKEDVKRLIKVKKMLSSYPRQGRGSLPMQEISSRSNTDYSIAMKLKDMGDAFAALESYTNALKAYQDAKKLLISYLREITDNGRNKYLVKKFEFSRFARLIKELDSKMANLKR
ncbi:MAG: hypothetical protein D6785_11640 [Planctomycetota bacterium]|nr:MAG: hypothetical protein D6785_11640 [Planctomycetota bacterium]